MAATAFCFSNSLSHHGIIKKKDVSLCGLVVKDLRKAKTTRVAAIRTTFLKTKMMLDQNRNYPDMAPDLWLGRMIKDGFVFRQNFHIRSYEVGPDQKATTETIMNLLQETSINSVKAIGVWGGGLGLTREMCKKKLIWVMAKLEVVVDSYPIWEDVIQIDTWKGAYGKNAACSNWTFCDGKTGEMLLRASCVWLVMNEETRRLSKFPNEVRGELDQHFTDITPPMVKEITRNWPTLDGSIEEYTRSGLMPIKSDLDVNQHVNYVNYARWILESVPHSIVEKYELADMTLEYCRECRKGDVLQSRTYVIGIDTCKLADYDHVDCEHVLLLENKDRQIMKGWTTWRSKQITK